MESDGSEGALNITQGEDLSEGHVGTEGRLLNAYGSPVVVRGQNENRAAARREEDVSESRSVVNRVGRNFNFSFILKCMLLFAGFFPFQFLTKTNETELTYLHSTLRNRLEGLFRALYGLRAARTTSRRSSCRH